MKPKLILTTTMLAGVLALGSIHPALANNTEKPMSHMAKQYVSSADMNLASQRFVESVNYARIALAMNDPALAKKHIAKARAQVAILKAGAEKGPEMKSFRTSRVHYEYDTRYKDHYFPIAAGPVAVKKVRSGPLWADTKGVAVTDAEIVYLTLNIDDDEVDERLDAAIVAIEKNDLTDAQSHLGEMIGDVVEVDESVDTPLDKARDNIGLTRQFIATRNYDGARFALCHADDALDDMEDDKRYINRRTVVESMRKEVKGLKEQIALKDPTALNKVDRTLEKWWKELRS